jgi:hypothetical protein
VHHKVTVALEGTVPGGDDPNTAHLGDTND